MRAPHGELRDFDNDGWQDLLTSVMVDSTDGGHDPLIYRNPGTTAGDIPRDRRPIWIRWPATGRGTPRSRSATWKSCSLMDLVAQHSGVKADDRLVITR